MRASRMIRSTAAAATGCAIVVSLFAAPAFAKPAGPMTRSLPRTAGPCALTRNDSEVIQDFSIRIIQCAADRWPVPGGAEKAICIAQRESGLIPTASSATGQYLGLFQHSRVSWPSRYADWTAPAWHLRTHALNGRTNTIVTLRMVHGFGGWAPAGWKVRGC